MDFLFDIDFIRNLARNDCISWSNHSLLRMEERQITFSDIYKCIESGEIIEEYPLDKPDPSCLILGLNIKDNVLHVVVSIDDSQITIITSYYPDFNFWEDDFKTRKR